MMKKPFVTVLMPVYNGGEYLKTSVRSVLNQTYKDFEFLIINDCSTDNSVKIIESFNDNRIVIHNNEKNLGQTKSLNIGLRLAKGKYVARMDADDMAYPMWLEKLVNYVKEHPAYAAVGTSAVVIDSKGRQKEIRRAPISSHEIIFCIFFAPPIYHVSVLLNKDMIIENGGYDEEFKITQDYELWSSLIRNGYCLLNIPDILVAYRVHSNSIGFIESKRRGFEEKSETILRNVNALTDLKITYSKAQDICKLFYHTAELSPEEFKRAQRNFEKIYLNLKEEFRIPLELAEKGIKNQMLKPYLKLSAFEIQNDMIKKARLTVSEYLRRYGFHIMPFLMYLITFSGVGLSKKTPNVYEKWQRMITEISLKFKSHKRNI